MLPPMFRLPLALFLMMQFATALSLRADDSPVSSEWAKGFESRSRLIGARVDSGLTPKILAGVEIEMSDDWKTYWRTPGDAGGVPPEFDWSKSENLEAARVGYPVPERFMDDTGVTLGYKRSVIFPVSVVAKDTAKPIVLRLALAYGICKDICVPVEAILTAELPATANTEMPEALAKSLAKVPRKTSETLPNDPRIARFEAILSGAKPKLVFECEFAGGSAEADAFVEVPPGAYLPQPVKTAENGNRVTFEVDLSHDADVNTLKGTELLLTLTGTSGQSEIPLTIE